MSDKSPDAYRTISEAAKELDLPAHVLRFWESKFPQLKPVKRAGGRRYYRPGDIALLRGVKHLLYEDGFTIKGAQKFIRDNGVAAVAGHADGTQIQPEPPAIAERYAPPPGDSSPTVMPSSLRRDLSKTIKRLEEAKIRLDSVLSEHTR